MIECDPSDHPVSVVVIFIIATSLKLQANRFKFSVIVPLVDPYQDVKIGVLPVFLMGSLVNFCNFWPNLKMFFSETSDQK